MLAPKRTRWTPESEEDRDAVRRALDEVLLSPQFCNSKRYPALLRYVVEQALEGNADQIKERTVGVEVFGRPHDYDTNNDTVVRYTAGEVRKRLALYYHGANDVPVQITLSARSYLPEFLRLVADEETPAPPAEAANEETTPLPVPLIESPEDSAGIPWGRTALVFMLGALLGTLLLAGGERLWKRYPTQSVDRFWSTVFKEKGPVLICPGIVRVSPTPDVASPGTHESGQNSFLSFENGLAMGRVAALLSAKGMDYRVQSAASTNFSQIRENPVVLVGAYNNDWAQSLLKPLRFHFTDEPNESIVDTRHPGRIWKRSESKPYSDQTDYAIAARFRNPSTDSLVIVLAGLQRYGTDAASQFVISSRLLDELTNRAGTDWTAKNLEVVLKVDVINGRVGAPIIEDVEVW